MKAEIEGQSLPPENLVDMTRIPAHIAIIPDGNRRWAKQQGHPFRLGHEAGATRLIEIVIAAKKLGVKTVTFYLFSTENWSRSAVEISALMWLLKAFCRNHADGMKKEGVRLKTIGVLDALPNDVQQVIAETIEYTKIGNHINMVLGLNYGGRDDIARAVKRIVDKCRDENLPSSDINEALIATHLDTAPWGDPDLLIRSGGEKRVSNFLLWQISYSELYITDALWPDFTPQHLHKAIADYQKRERRLGGT